MGKSTHFFGHPVYGQLINCLNINTANAHNLLFEHNLLKLKAKYMQD